MLRYKVYFEIYGRKMQTTVLAENEYDAMHQITGEILFHKVENVGDNGDCRIQDAGKDAGVPSDGLEELKRMMGMS